MNRPRRWTAILAALILPAAVSCGDSVLPFHAPVPGTLVVSLQTTEGRTPAGAILISLRGQQIEAPAAIDGAGSVFVHQIGEDGSQWQVAVVGAEVSGALFAFAVPDVMRPEAYTAQIIQVADRADNLLPDLAGYRLTVLPKR